MKRFLGMCLVLSFVGCGKESQEKSQQAVRGDSRAASGVAKPVPTQPSRSAKPPKYDEEPPARRLRTRITPALQKEVEAFLNEPPLKVSATDLIKAYQNPAVGDKDFKDRKVWVTGYVLRRGRGTLGAPYVELEPGKNQSGAVRCFFEKGRSVSVDELKENQDVTVEGRVSAKTGNEVRLDGCRILTPAEMQSIIDAARDQ